MVYLIVRTVDRTSKDPYLDVMQPKRGDVTSWRPEGTPLSGFGTKVLSNADFLIVHCPDMTEAEAKSYCTPQPGDVKENPMLQYRSLKIDLDSLPSDKKTFADKKGQIAPRAGADFSITKATLDPLKKVAEFLEDPHVIGDSKNVIG